MEAKLLNLEDALSLASILSKYIDTVSFDPEQLALDFIDGILNKIEPQEYLYIVKLLSGEPTVKIAKSNGDELLKLVFSGLEKNKILSLLDAHSKIGFV